MTQISILKTVLVILKLIFGFYLLFAICNLLFQIIMKVYADEK